MEEIVYLNGSLIPVSRAQITVMDYGFLYGYGLFETMRAYNGSVFRLDSHIARLAGSAVKLGIKLNTSILKKAITDTLMANKLRDARIRLTASIGQGSPSPDLRSCTSPNLLIVATQYTPFAVEIYEKGFNVIISSIRRNSTSTLSAMKTTSYMENLLARQQAKASYADDVLFLNEKQHLSEASTSNVFLVSNNTLKTPPLYCGILPGITRDIILRLASQMSIEAIETDISLVELEQADEIFLSNSIMEIMPVTKINGNSVFDGNSGRITRQLIAGYKELVRRETCL